jgi:putative component of toxin-antitoxin plasmid stabilization module
MVDGARLYFVLQGENVLILLGDGDEATQARDVEAAKRTPSSTIMKVIRALGLRLKGAGGG